MIPAKRLDDFFAFGLYAEPTHDEFNELVTAYEALREWVSALLVVNGDVDSAETFNKAMDRIDDARDDALALFPETPHD